MSGDLYGAEGLPGNWTDLTSGLTPQQAGNLFYALDQHARIAVYRDGKPVAVLLSAEDYLTLRAAEEFMT